MRLALMQSWIKYNGCIMKEKREQTERRRNRNRKMNTGRDSKRER